MSNFLNDILEAADNEPILAIVIGEMGWTNYNDEGKPDWSTVKGKLISWEDAQQYLNYEYDTGYGAPDCQAITAWTENKVIFVCQYDGATWVSLVPRHPIEYMPVMFGG